jgi:hypothetical protein
MVNFVRGVCVADDCGMRAMSDQEQEYRIKTTEEGKKPDRRSRNLFDLPGSGAVFSCFRLYVVSRTW